jgi:hypothetical protein
LVRGRVVLKLFIYAHRSITDPAFYREVVAFGSGRVVLFLIELVVLSALLDGVSHTRQLFDRGKGLPAVLPSLLPGMEIRDGRLDPKRPTPFVADRAYGVALGKLLEVVPGVTAEYGDSFVVVDTAQGAFHHMSTATRYGFGPEYIVINSPPFPPTVVPYTAAGPGRGAAPAAQVVVNLLRLHLGLVFCVLAIQHCAVTTANVLFAVFFLAVAAYIFRREKAGHFKAFLKMACFAVSPLPIGRALVALSATRAEWMWHASIIVSTFVMFRAVRGMSQKRDRAGSARRRAGG